jgi:glutamyl/glutaminyl-tRNA synthetase
MVWGVARACNGRVLLRIEDHDRQRSRPEFTAALLEDLAWLGFRADEPPVRQSARGDIYQRALETLRQQGLVYACACSRADVESRAPASQAGVGAGVARAFQAGVGTRVARAFQAREGHELRYPGTCRERGLPDAPGRGLRVRLEPSVERFVDLRHGPREQRPSEQCGDVLVRDREGNWTYQFAAAVDDYVQGVTLVIRGDDLLESTGRQLQLARLVGRKSPPRFLHHPLIMKSAAQKLSKSDRDSGVRDLRAAGWRAESVIGEAAARAGLIAAKRDIRADEVSRIMAECGLRIADSHSDSDGGWRNDEVL